jgi:hypothetical protein
MCTGTTFGVRLVNNFWCLDCIRYDSFGLLRLRYHNSAK